MGVGESLFTGRHDPGRVERAQDAFKRMMQEQVAPALRRLGFKGSGQTFTLPSDTHWALIGFQKSVWGNSHELRFTVNLTVVGKQAWESARVERPFLGARPTANTSYGFPTWRQRIGFLLPERLDLWWPVVAGSSTESAAEEVIAAIRDYALPEMNLQVEGAPDA
jgi:hypothetical protein